MGWADFIPNGHLQTFTLGRCGSEAKHRINDLSDIRGFVSYNTRCLELFPCIPHRSCSSTDFFIMKNGKKGEKIPFFFPPFLIK